MIVLDSVFFLKEKGLGKKNESATLPSGTGSLF